MQRYYLDETSSFHRYFSRRYPGSMDHISTRCNEVTVPAIARLLACFRSRSLPVLFFRLCGTAPDRSDLHRFFKRSDDEARERGFPDIYPLESDPYSDIVRELSPYVGELVVTKTGFGGFTRGKTAEELRDIGVNVLVMTGLATSQCVETTARQASELGFSIVMVEDAVADYSDESHYASLVASRGVLGGTIVDSASLEDDLVRSLGTVR